MATIIKASCTACEHDVTLLPESLHLFVMDTGRNHYYVFCCPCCFELIRQDATPGVVLLLRSACVPETDVHVPLEIVEIEQCTQAPRLTNDDLLDFVLELNRWSGVDLV